MHMHAIYLLGMCLHEGPAFYAYHLTISPSSIEYRHLLQLLRAPLRSVRMWISLRSCLLLQRGALARPPGMLEHARCHSLKGRKADPKGTSIDADHYEYEDEK